MNLIVLGASGGLGRAVVDQAQARGHCITAVTRNQPPPSMAGVRWVRADLLSEADLDRVLPGHDGVIAAVAPRLRFRQKTTLFSMGAERLATGMARHGIRRLLWTTSAGVEAEDLAATRWFFRRVFSPLFLSGVYADCVLSEHALRKTDLDWTFVRPTMLTDGPVTRDYRVANGRTPEGGQKISRGDVAAFMLDEIEHPAFLHACPVLAY